MPQTILPTRDRIIVVRDGRDRQVLAYGRDGRVDRSFPSRGALDPEHGDWAPPAALQDDKLLVLERHYGAHPSFALRRLLLR